MWRGKHIMLLCASLVLILGSIEYVTAQDNEIENLDPVLPTGSTDETKEGNAVVVEDSGLSSATVKSATVGSVKDAKLADVEELPETVSEAKPAVEAVSAVSARSGKYYDLQTGVEDALTRSGRYFEQDNVFNPNDLDNGIYDSLTSRTSPSEPPRQRDPTYIITEARLREIRSHFMYWYFDKGGDNDQGDYQTDIHTSTPQVHKNFNFQLPFFGFRYNYTRLSMHGYVEFSDPPEHYTYPLVFPIKDWPKRNDPAFIGIFFSRCRIGNIRPEDADQRRPGVYFRLERDLMSRTDQFGVEVRERLMWDIREGVVGSNTFVPKHAAIITWKNMTFAGGIDNSLYLTNTFQMVLATDEVYTYAIFNYGNLQWLSHTEAGGDTTTGEGGVPAYIGFNGGNGTQSYEYKPYSQASVLRDLTGTGFANNFTGRHIFRIDEKIMLGTCNKDIDSADLPLVFAPESGNMLGGTAVNISGPCFEENVRILCRFDTVSVVGHRIDRNRAVCVQPYLMAQGYVRFEIAIGTDAFKWKGKYFVETPASAADQIFFPTFDVHERSPKEIKMTWNKYNLTTNQNAGVRISLWGYREGVHNNRPELEYIDMIEEAVTNTGEYVIAPGNYRLRENIWTNDMQFGFIHINLTNTNGVVYSPVLWSKPIPLGWYFGPQWERKYGIQWPRKLCDNWLKTDRFLRNFASEISVCPCTLEHALNDKGRFMPDFECDRYSNPSCMYHEGAVHCVRTGTPSLEGAEQQCCYDRNGYLMMSYDQKWGSRPRRSHNLGVLPWNEPTKVPTLSTWFHDITPYYSCCLWQEEQAVGCETLRFERRPTQDCVAYQAPAVGAVFGDPHFITFDNLAYTFNGMGEFVLVRGNTGRDKLEIQGRFERVSPSLYGPVQATHLTSVVASGNTSTIIEVRVRPKHAQWRYRLDVFANGKRIYFDRPALKFQHFKDVTVYTPTYILNQSEVVIMFASGAGVEVVENQGFMTARVYLPWTFINKTRGLLGNWSWDMTDDFVKPDGTLVALNLNSFESIHKEFAQHWMLADRESAGVGSAMFTREFGRTASYYSNASFVPNWLKEPRDFLPTNRSVDINRANELCGESYQCRYDYGMSLNRDMAHFTKNYYDSAVNIRERQSKRILSCGILETPRFGRKSTFLFIPGTRVSFECNQGFILTGDPRRVCLDDGRWDVPVHGYTECLREIFYTTRSAWLTAGIIFAVMVPILILLGVCILFFRRRAEKQKEVWDFAPRSRSNSRANLRASMASLSPKAGYKDPGPDLDSDLGHGLGSDLSSGSGGTLRARRQYDEVYRTNEPLKGKPEVEFPDKKFDLNEDDITSSGSSDNNRDNVAKPTSDFKFVEPPRQLGRSRQKLNSDPIPESIGEVDPEDDDSDAFHPTLPETSPPDSPMYTSINKPTPQDEYRAGFSNRPAPPVPPLSPMSTLTQNVGLPRSNSRSTEV